jgi:(5-formylfuran-3-yl)methyl phosphate synthase
LRKRLDKASLDSYVAEMNEPVESSLIINLPPVAPRLLVSVRDLEEARIAHHANVDLIDLKEPHKGSLGMVELSTAQQIAEELPQATLSLALGELAEWRQKTSVSRIPTTFRYLKIGLTGEVSNSYWREEWQSFRNKIDAEAEKSFRWIAVVYADYELAKSPTPDVIIEAAIETGCAGVLFDTWSKQSGSLLDLVSVEQLEKYRKVIQAAGLLTAFAGSLRETHLPTVRPIGADIIAVRGAICEENNRVGTVSASRIKAFQDVLKSPIGQPG